MDLLLSLLDVTNGKILGSSHVVSLICCFSVIFGILACTNELSKGSSGIHHRFLLLWLFSKFLKASTVFINKCYNSIQTYQQRLEEKKGFYLTSSSKHDCKSESNSRASLLNLVEVWSSHKHLLVESTLSIHELHYLIDSLFNWYARILLVKVCWCILIQYTCFSQK